MSRPVSARRCPLARLESVWARADMDSELRDLATSLARRVRRETPDAAPMVRMLQALALQVWLRAQVGEDQLLTLNRSLSELNRTLRTLGIRPPTSGNRQTPQAYGPRKSVFSARAACTSR